MARASDMPLVLPLPRDDAREAFRLCREHYDRYGVLRVSMIHPATREMPDEVRVAFWALINASDMTVHPG